VVAEYVHGVSGLDGPVLEAPSRSPESRHAVELMAQVVETSDRPVTLVPVGPLTNVALFLAVYPELAARLRRIVLMGGSIGMGNVTPSAEFNIYVDPEAAHRVFGSGLDVTMIGLDVTHRALLRPDDAARLAAGGRVSRFVADLYGFFSRHEPAGGADGVPVHDALAVAHVIWDDLVVTETRPVEIDLGEPGRGRTVVDRRRRGARHGPINVATDVDGERFADLLVEQIESLD
jgi:inosine-uridine nucleoside N-ribohydrolase